MHVTCCYSFIFECHYALILGAVGRRQGEAAMPKIERKNLAEENGERAQATAAFKTLIETFPQSKHLAEAQKHLATSD
jgi:hypothetical protein